MRLTLRTLLAYMDDTLEPVHAREIGQKVAESPFAQKLMARLQDVMRRRRLSAPKLHGPGAGLDPNTVAEYLDNTLPPERVAEVEKSCLESDVHLAEVAACHQVLTLVLGEPADVSEDTRQRMYDLAAGQALAGGPEPQAPVATREPAATAGTFAETMPEFLRRAPWWRRPLPLTAAILAVLALAATAYLFVAGRSARDAQLAQSDVAAEAALEEPAPAKAADSEPAPADVGQDAERPAPPKTPDRVSGDEEPEPAAAPTVQLEAPRPGSEEFVPEPSGTSETAGSEATSEEEPDEAVAKLSPTLVEPPAPSPPPPAPPETEPAAASPVESPAARPSAIPQPVAQYATGTGLLLTYAGAGDQWQRLPGRAYIFPGDSLLSAPAYRSRLTLNRGGQLDLLGGTRLDVLPPDRQGVIQLRLQFGRLVVRDAPIGTALNLLVDGSRWQLTLAGPDTVLAAAVDNEMPSGFESTLARPSQTVTLIVPRGEVRWSGTGGQGTVEAPAKLTLRRAGQASDAVALLAPLGQAPSWVDRERLGLLEQRAARILQNPDVIGFDREITLSLIELTQDSRREVRSLAVDCLGAMGRFDALFEALTDIHHDEVRSRAIVWLRRWLARGGEHAAAVRNALADFRRGEEAKRIDRLLWGFTERDLRDGAAGELIAMLEHHDLAVRELAISNLLEITGKTLNYRAADPEDERYKAVLRWRQLYRGGDLTARPVGR